ncbi:acyl-CoA dehydrogenase family protein [Cyclobacterium lianum]|uniref:acyl-CoA dehydrogenase family protein n=1 Tax=Cyclobacterium lianum TaxID=388280 RepID=UPI0029371657|nr:acyl-CoA dehydrogenase family protein [Cyclobacterium lianum]
MIVIDRCQEQFAERDAAGYFARSGATAKLYVSKVAMEVTKEVVQIHRGYGYVREYPAERMIR